MQIPLTLVSYLSPNLFKFYTEISAYLERTLDRPVQIQVGSCDPLSDPILYDDQLDIALICGLPFARFNQMCPHQLQPLVAPVMQADRYLDRPIYFSDVIVRAESDIFRLSQLQGKTFCYNDRGSNSGYHLMGYRLFQDHYPATFFGQVLASGAHQNSIQWVVAGKADCAAIDSTVLEQELRVFPHLATQLRIVESIGPCPMPPIVAAQRLGQALLRQIQAALLHPDQTLQQHMQQVGIRRLATVRAEEYDVLPRLVPETFKLQEFLLDH